MAMNEEFSSSFEDDEAWFDAADPDPEASDDESDDEMIFGEDEEGDEEFALGEDEEGDEENLVNNEENRVRYSAGTPSSQVATDRRLQALRNRAVARARVQQRRAARLSKVSGATKVAIARPATTAGSKVLIARTPQGRILRMQLKDGIVTAKDHNKFVESATRSLGGLGRGVAKNGKAISLLRNEQAKTAKTLAGQQATMTNAISKEVGRIQKTAQLELRKEAVKVRKLAKDAARRQTLNNLTLATSIPLFRVYGDSTDPFSTRNLTLLAATLGATYADDLLQAFTKGNTSSQISTAWSYGAPLLLAGGIHLAFKDSPHENQFVLSTVQVGAAGDIEVANIAAKKDSQVVAALNLPDGLTANLTQSTKVDADGKLKLNVTGTMTTGAVATTALVIVENKS
jgi:hypothetical protein